MKKFLILTLLIAGAMPVMANPGLNPSTINSIQSLQGFGTHELNSYRQQRFRYEEINDAKDIKEQKEKFKRQQEQQEIVEDPAMKRIFNRQPQQDVKFVEEDGQIKIEGVEIPKE